MFRNQPTDVEHRDRQLDVTKVSRTLLLAFATGSAHLTAVDGAEFGVVQALLSWPVALLVHRFRVLDMTDAHVLDLFG